MQWPGTVAGCEQELVYSQVTHVLPETRLDISADYSAESAI